MYKEENKLHFKYFGFGAGDQTKQVMYHWAISPGCSPQILQSRITTVNIVMNLHQETFISLYICIYVYIHIKLCVYNFIYIMHIKCHIHRMMINVTSYNLLYSFNGM
jgi:hypothetical protein